MKPRLLHCLLCLVLASAWCAPLRAHQDRIIELKGHELAGLPKEYQPAELNLKESRIRIGTREMTFSPLLKSLFDQPHDLTLTASWYHEKSTLPPYILIRIQPKKKDFSYGLLMNLETLDVIELKVRLQESDSSSRELPVALSDRQKEAIKASIRKLK